MEIEFKFCADPAQRPALHHAVQALGQHPPNHPPRRLQATYFDTPDGRLAAAQAALRIRREGSRWVQTAKAMAADGPLLRLEDNVDLGPAAEGDAPPPPDWQRHAGTPVGERLATLLSGGPPLQATYGTDIWRTLGHIRQGDAVVELALDEGRIFAPGASGQTRESPVLELELTTDGHTPTHPLVHTLLPTLAEVAAQWVQQHGLWIDTRSKAERGERLMRGEPEWPVAHARPTPGQPQLGAALAHLLPNLQAMAAGQGNREHAQQARLALQALHALGHLDDRLAAQVNQQLAEHLLTPGAPAAPATPAATWVGIARNTALQQTLVQLLCRAA